MPRQPDRASRLPATPLRRIRPFSLVQDALPSPNQLLTDRTSYIAYLESQLERVAAACLTVQVRRQQARAVPIRRTCGYAGRAGRPTAPPPALLAPPYRPQSFDERLEQAVSAIRSLEEKTLNLARLVSVAQQYAEQQEAAQREGAADLARRLRGVEGRLAELEQPERAAEWESRLRAGPCGVGRRGLRGSRCWLAWHVPPKPSCFPAPALPLRSLFPSRQQAGRN